MAQWIRPQVLNCEVPGSNVLVAAVVPLGKALYLHCLVPWKGLVAFFRDARIQVLAIYFQAICFSFLCTN